MATIDAFVHVVSDDYRDSFTVVGATPLGDRYVFVTNYLGYPLQVDAVCRIDVGRDFRMINPPVWISPGRSTCIDMTGLELRPSRVLGEPRAWPVIDPDLDYKLVATFGMYNDGWSWRYGTGPDDDLGPVFPRPALGDRP